MPNRDAQQAQPTCGYKDWRQKVEIPGLFLMGGDGLEPPTSCL
jgi:hypothetical protein